MPRYPKKSERQNLIRSGNISVHEKNATGARDWQDGRDWLLISSENETLVEKE